jgi:ABC-type branched-subunit amino acid transport system ATPase component
MAMVPRFLLLDEPAAGLAPDELRLLGKVIRKLKTEGLGVLLVEHNVPFVLELASEVTVLHEGQRLAVGSPRELRDNVDVRRSFLGAML